MTRLRSPAQRAPQTKEQALGLLSRFSAIAAAIAAVQADRQRLHQEADVAADALVVPLAAEMKDIVKQLKPWWAASIDALTGGKRKSIELGGCIIGYRLNPPKIDFADGTDDEAVAALLGASLGTLVRQKPSPDKAAILKQLEASQPERLKGLDEEAIAKARAATERLEKLGFSIKQGEVFFVDPVTPDDANDAHVEDRDAGAVA